MTLGIMIKNTTSAQSPIKDDQIYPVKNFQLDFGMKEDLIMIQKCGVHLTNGVRVGRAVVVPVGLVKVPRGLSVPVLVGDQSAPVDRKRRGKDLRNLGEPGNVLEADFLIP